VVGALQKRSGRQNNWTQQLKEPDLIYSKDQDSWRCFALGAWKVRVVVKNAISYLRVSHKNSQSTDLPNDFAESVTLLSDDRMRHGFESLGDVLSKDMTTVSAEELLKLPDGIMLHYHGDVGSDSTFETDLERLVVLHHEQGESSIVSVVSGRSITVNTEVVRQLTL